MAKCRICLGSGKIPDFIDSCYVEKICPDCHGTGICMCGACEELEVLYPEDYES